MDFGERISISKSMSQSLFSSNFCSTSALSYLFVANCKKFIRVLEYSTSLQYPDISENVILFYRTNKDVVRRRES